jgi:hypothetical protein
VWFPCLAIAMAGTTPGPLSVVTLAHVCVERWIEGENGRRGGGEELRGASRSVWECVKQISREGPYKHLYIFTTIFGFAMYIRLSSHKVPAQ